MYKSLCTKYQGRRQKKNFFRGGQRPITTMLFTFLYPQKGGPNFFQRGPRPPIGAVLDEIHKFRFCTTILMQIPNCAKEGYTNRTLYKNSYILCKVYKLPALHVTYSHLLCSKTEHSINLFRFAIYTSTNSTTYKISKIHSP